MSVSTKTLKALAAVVWCTGGVVLVVKGYSLLKAAMELQKGPPWPWLAGAMGIMAGAIRGKALFSRSCRKNLERIDGLKHPRPWDFYRPWFFFFLALMIITGAILTRLAHGNYIFLNLVAMLDLSIGIGLLGSSHIFLRKMG